MFFGWLCFKTLLKTNFCVLVWSLFCLPQEQDAKPAAEPLAAQADPVVVPVAPAEPPAEVVDETWEEQEDKQNAEPESKAESTDKKYQYKEGRLTALF